MYFLQVLTELKDVKIGATLSQIDLQTLLINQEHAGER